MTARPRGRGYPRVHEVRPTVRFFISLLIALAVVKSALAQIGGSWHELQDKSLEVVEGSALDFSALRGVGAAGEQGWVQTDQNGHLRFDGDMRPRRFLCASMVPSEPNGGLPGKAETDRWVDQLTRTGYNLVRLHYMDAILMTGRSGNFNYDPVALDRLHYLMARLKAAGIYWIVDGMTSDNGGYGDVRPHQWVNRHDLKGRLFFDGAAVEHWKRLVATIWAQKNPYTGVAPINDPAMLGMILVNEPSLAVYLESLKDGAPPELGNQYAAWQALREVNGGATLADSRGAKDDAVGRLDKSQAVPRNLRGNGAAEKRFAAFSVGLEAALFQSLDDYVRALGFKGLTSSFNFRSFYHADVVRSKAGWVDMHAYQSLPTSFASPGSNLPQTSIFDDVGRYGRMLANARQWGKPFTVTEYGQPFWNQWRYESTAWLPALAAFQDWDAICQFAELPVLLRYGESAAPRRRAIYPFAVGGDPITRGGERLAALLFLRGDVEPSRGRAVLGLNPQRVFGDGNAWGQVPENLSRLALAVATGLDLSAGSPRLMSGQEIYFPLDTQPDGWVEKAANGALRHGILVGRDPVRRLRSSGLLSRNNQTDYSEGLIESDTGQLVFDAPRKKLSIETQRTVVFTQRSGSARAGGVELTALSSPATIAVGALDDRGIGQSRRLLVWVLTDAINTGMEFDDRDRTTLKTLGRFPPRIRGVTGQLAIKHSEARALKVWAIDQAGRRVDEIPARVRGGVLRFSIKNVVPEFGPVTYFEVADR